MKINPHNVGDDGGRVGTPDIFHRADINRSNRVGGYLCSVSGGRPLVNLGGADIRTAAIVVAAATNQQ